MDRSRNAVQVAGDGAAAEAAATVAASALRPADG
jgi:hypothetical protein